MPAIPMRQIDKYVTHGRGRVLWLAGVTTVAMAVGLAALSTAATAAGPAGSSFGDVTASTQFASDIAWLKASGISRGYTDGRFRPASSLSRAAAAAFLYRLAGSPSVSSTEEDAVRRRFNDLGDRTQFLGAIAWMSGRRITAGYRDGTFRPDAAVTRGAMAAFLYRYSSGATDALASNYVPGTFRDVSTATSFAGDIAWLAAAGVTQRPSSPITHGYPDKTYRPDSALRRGAAAALLHRIGQARAAGDPAESAPLIKSKSLVSASAGNAYGTTISVENASSVSVAGLPAGLSSSFSGGVLTISGTPTAMGTSSVTVTARGPGGTATKVLFLIVGAHVWTVTDITGGAGTEDNFSNPHGVAIDASGSLYVADTGNNMIRKITDGVMSTLAGPGDDLSYPNSVAVDSAGNVYVADPGNNMIREITAAGEVLTLAGGGDGLVLPYGVAVDSAGNVYVADTGNNMIRKITDGVMTTLAGPEDGLHSPYGVAVDSAGAVYIADSGSNIIRKISPTGDIATLAGSGVAGDEDGPGVKASFYSPQGVVVDSSGYVYVTDYGFGIAREITPDGDVSTLSGPDGPLKFEFPSGVAVDSAGHVYVVDNGNNRIRKMQ